MPNFPPFPETSQATEIICLYDRRRDKILSVLDKENHEIGGEINTNAGVERFKTYIVDKIKDAV
jgi:hypothetical protein